MSSKKKGAKVPVGSNQNEAKAQNDFMSVKYYMHLGTNDYKIFVVPNRPVQSRIVNENSLRPHGAVAGSEFSPRGPSHDIPESVVDDVMVLVNDAQRRIHRIPDFTPLGDVQKAAKSLHTSAYRQWWMNRLANQCVSADTFPSTVLQFTTPSAGVREGTSNIPNKTCNPFLGTAAAIQRILIVYTQCLENGDRAMEKILFHTIRNDNASDKELILTNYNGNHILVCCGPYFYRVTVLDQNGTIISANSIAALLQAASEHAKKTEDAFFEQTLLPDVMHDMTEFHKLLCCMSEIHRDECRALMERLRGANPVNATVLDTMDSAIFTVVLRNPGREDSPRARWYRSSLILEEDSDGSALTMRTHAVAVDRASIVDFLLKVINWKDEQKKFRGPDCLAHQTGEELFDDTPSETAFIKHLNIWLPWKHRKPIWPYSKKAVTTSAFPLDFPLGNERWMTFTELCLSAILAVEEVLTPSDGFPTVLVSFPHPLGGISSAMLYTSEVEIFIQSLRGESALNTRRTVQHMGRAALQSLETLVDDCFNAPYPLYTMAQLLLSEGQAQAEDAVCNGGFLGNVDLVISIDPLDSSGDVLHMETRLMPSSTFTIRSVGRGIGSALQQRAVAKKPSALRVVAAKLLQTPGTEDSTVGKRLAACVLEKCSELSLLMGAGRLSLVR
uniref:Uncharacterized protein TCIL3000_11_8850 n=1 Tax=Trypanosoma congolense (strain IL3000) TaxID=1068625 RepID=G0V1A7_TRYCI|nr:unnamed protein product [Trypanosoma congolense IL3000]